MSLRNLQDATLNRAWNLPAAGASAACAAIDLGATNIEQMEVRLQVPACPALTDGQTLTYVFQDSADGATWAAIPALASVVRTGASGAGTATFTHEVRLPSSARRYLRANATASGTADNNTAVQATLIPLF